MRVPHIPIWPKTSYNGNLRTKNSSAAFADDLGVSGQRLKFVERTTLTESIQGGTKEHE